eukprot:TRINITY_DN747_c4_g2_i1.p1 TRINITY_DN747_c4_g2~~TRINITY_DN747_c4_g2_i1.p1  ORF type:complete len:875 (+),score=196.84 TRINITY_DN747_c4_g2_i1:55-2625(+)
MASDRRHQAVSVAVRVRPLRPDIGEENSGWDIEGNTLLERGNPDVKFSFNHVYTREHSTLDIYNGCVAGPIVQSCMAGFNATVFAYGQTSSGKSFTMLGEGHHQGIVPLAVGDMFRHVEEQQATGRDIVIKCSMLEIYNEHLRDLLLEDQPDQQRPLLRVVSSPMRGTYVDGAIRRTVTSPAQFIQYIHKEAAARRVQATHSMNLRSSRSHCIVRLDVECWEGGSIDASFVSENETSTRDVSASGVPTGNGSDSLKMSALHLVDLAGSERISKTGATGARKTEGANINKSLLFLGTVIEKLSNPDHKGYIPYRDSLLTKMLQTALGGNSVTQVIAAITEADMHKEETRSTLHFAYRASRVRNVISRNEISDDKSRVRKLETDIKSMRKALVAKQLSLLSSRLKLKKFQISGVAPQHTGTTKIIEALESANTALRQELSSRPSGASTGNFEELQSQLQQYQQRSEELEEDVKQLQEAQDTLEGLCKELEEENDTKIKKVDRFRKEKKAAETQLASVRNANVELQDKVLQLEAEKKGFGEKMENELSRVRQQGGSEAMQEVTELRKQLTELTEKHNGLLQLYTQAETGYRQNTAAQQDAEKETTAEIEKLKKEAVEQAEFCRRLMKAASTSAVDGHKNETGLVKEREIAAVEKQLRSFISSRQSHPPAVLSYEPPVSQLKQLTNVQNKFEPRENTVEEDEEFPDIPVRIRGMDAETKATRRRRPNTAGSVTATASNMSVASVASSSAVSSAFSEPSIAQNVATQMQERILFLEDAISQRDSQRDVIIDTKLKRMQDLLVRLHGTNVNLEQTVNKVADDARQLREFIDLRRLTGKLPPNLVAPLPASDDLINACKTVKR